LLGRRAMPSPPSHSFQQSLISRSHYQVLKRSPLRVQAGSLVVPRSCPSGSLAMLDQFGPGTLYPTEQASPSISGLFSSSRPYCCNQHPPHHNHPFDLLIYLSHISHTCSLRMLTAARSTLLIATVSHRVACAGCPTFCIQPSGASVGVTSPEAANRSAGRKLACVPADRAVRPTGRQSLYEPHTNDLVSVRERCNAFRRCRPSFC